MMWFVTAVFLLIRSISSVMRMLISLGLRHLEFKACEDAISELGRAIDGAHRSVVYFSVKYRSRVTDSCQNLSLLEARLKYLSNRASWSTSVYCLLLVLLFSPPPPLPLPPFSQSQLTSHEFYALGHTIRILPSTITRLLSCVPFYI